MEGWVIAVIVVSALLLVGGLIAVGFLWGRYVGHAAGMRKQFEIDQAEREAAAKRIRAMQAQIAQDAGRRGSKHSAVDSWMENSRDL